MDKNMAIQKHGYAATGGAVAVSLVMSKRENNTNPGVVYMNEAFHAIPHTTGNCDVHAVER